MARAKLYLLDGGNRQILSAAAGFSSFAPHSFVIGDLAGFEGVQKTEKTPRGNTVYTGDGTLMQSRLLEEGVVRYTMIVPEGVGPFKIGNLIMNTVGLNQEPVPYAMLVLPFPIYKKASEFDSGASGLPNPGNRLLFSFTIKHEIVDGTSDDVLIEVIAPEYSNLPYFDSEARVPAPALVPWAQFILQKPALTGVPALVARGSDDRFWIQPFYRDLRHPAYNVMSGGASGDGYRQSPYSWLWGQRFLTAKADFRGTIGGYPFKAIGVANLNRVGGVPFKPQAA